MGGKVEKRSFRQLFFQSPLRVITHVFVVCVVIFLIVRLIIVLVIGEDPDNRLFSYFAVSLLFLLPYAYELIFRRRISTFVLLFYVLYVFVSGALGNCLGFYGRFLGFDKVMHSLFGYVGCIIGLLAVCKMADYHSLSPTFVSFVCFAVSLACGAVWEIIEFSGDTLLGQSAQGFLVQTTDGALVRALLDTMLDLISNFIGALVFVIHYLFHRLIERNLIIGSMVQDFVS